MPSPSRLNLAQWFRILIATAVVCGALSIGTVAGVLASTFQVMGRPSERIVKGLLNRDQAQEDTSSPMDFIKMFQRLDRKVNILVMGSDHSYDRRGKRITDPELEKQSPTRSDTMMLVGIDPHRQEINVLSIPRDTRVLISGSHYDKINAAFAYGGVDLAKRTVQDLTGVTIDYTLALKVDGLINMVDTIGGVRIYVEKDMYYVDETAHLGINIHKGWKRMNGEQAHQYVRFRKDELGDIGRVQRQQKFVRAAIEQMMQPQSWLKIPELMARLQDNVVTDMPVELFGQIARFSREIPREKMRMVMMPGTFSGSAYEVSYWLIHQQTANEVIHDLFPDTTLPSLTTRLASSDTTEPVPASSRYRISVWNASGDLPTGRMVVRKLREAGWNIWNIRKAPEQEKTQYVAQTGKSQVLPEIQAAVGFSGDHISSSIGDIGTEFTLIIGKDMVAQYQALAAEDTTMTQDAKLKNEGLSGEAPAYPVRKRYQERTRYPQRQSTAGQSQRQVEPVTLQADPPPVRQNRVVRPAEPVLQPVNNHAAALEMTYPPVDAPEVERLPDPVSE
jgi:LCP family protein required for cell wall assembly